ncbi:hypothetical protein V1511DRAFT_505621 [Dipodascopsis uninucleata]
MTAEKVNAKHNDVLAEKSTAEQSEFDMVAHLTREGLFKPESRMEKFIPGGYSPSRCIKLKGKSMSYAILMLAGTAIMFFGFDASCMSQVNTNDDYLRLMKASSGSSRDAAAIGGLVSLWFLGFLFGAVFTGYLADRVGRLKTIAIGCYWAILGAALQSSAQNFAWMSFGRILGGVGCGHLNTIVPIWTSEIADPHLRGAFVSFEFALAIVGQIIVYWTEYACTKSRSLSFSWRFPLGLQIIFLLFILVCCPFFPESPRHLVQTGHVDSAREVLERCRLHPDAEKIEDEINEILDSIALEKGAHHTFYSMLFIKDKQNTRRRIILGAGVQIMQKFTGIDFVVTYAPELFTLAGFSGDKSIVLAGCNFIGYFFSLLLAMYLSDHVGRRRLMLGGCLAMGILLLIGGILAHEVEALSDTNPAKTAQYAAGVATILYCYTFAYGSTWLTTCWVYPVEVFPLSCRAKGTALATVAFSIAGGVINEIIPYLTSAIGFWTLILFSLVNFVMLIPVYLFYVETARRHLEHLDILFSTSSPFVWKAEKEFEELLAQREATGIAPLSISKDAEPELEKEIAK